MDRKQNIFADIEDGLTKENAFEGIAMAGAFFIFIGLWIYLGTFVGALIIAVLSGPMISGVTILFIACASAVLAHREGDTLSTHFSTFVIALVPLSISGAFIYLIIRLMP
jgi:hypothetical protein